MLITLGLGSAVGFYTVIVQVACNIGEQRFGKCVVTAAILFIGFLFSMVYVTPGGQQILQLVDFFTSSFVIVVLAIIQSFAGSCFQMYHTNKKNLSKYFNSKLLIPKVNMFIF